MLFCGNLAAHHVRKCLDWDCHGIALSANVFISDDVITDLEQDTQKLKNALEHPLVENDLAP